MRSAPDTFDRSRRALVAGALLVLSALAPVRTAAATTLTFNYTGDAQTWVVPDGITSATFDLCGARGGASAPPSAAGGLGAHVRATSPVTTGATLTIIVGGKGGDVPDMTSVAVGGFNGGGSGGGGGGGASDVRTGTTPSDRILVAGGGGGGGNPGIAIDHSNPADAASAVAGGAGGASATAGDNGLGLNPVGGGGGGQPGTESTAGTGGAAGTGGGAAGGDGAAGQGGIGPADAGHSAAGGGGGGYYGGGSGGSGGTGELLSLSVVAAGGGGGGGSSFIAAGASDMLVDEGAAACADDGVVTIAFGAPAPTPNATPPPTPNATPQPGALNHFQCYDVHNTSTTPAGDVTVDDVFMPAGTPPPPTLHVGVPKRLCNPADDGHDPTAPTDPDHLVGYKVRGESPRFTPVRNYVVDDPEFGPLTVDVMGPDYLLVPSAKGLTDPGPTPTPGFVPTIDHFNCYLVKHARRRANVTVVDEFGSASDPLHVAIKRPRHLCVPTRKNGEPMLDGTQQLLCYQVRRGSGAFHTPFSVGVANQLTVDTLFSFRPTEFCVPIGTAPVPTSTAAATPTDAPTPPIEPTPTSGPTPLACGSAEYPTCGGSCDGGQVCQAGAYLERGNVCFCTDPATPCGGTCPNEPGFCADGHVCIFSQRESPLIECGCSSVPNPCEVSGFPTCGGNCGAGQVCQALLVVLDQSTTISECRCADANTSCGSTCGASLGTCSPGDVCLGALADNPNPPQCGCYTPG